MLSGMPDDADKLGLCRVVETFSGVFHKTSFKWLGGIRAFMGLSFSAVQPAEAGFASVRWLWL